MKKMLSNVLISTGLSLIIVSTAFAQVSGNTAQVGTFLTSAASWLVTILGPSLFLIGIIMVGISLAMGDQDAMRRGGYVIGGGALIFLSQSVVAILKQLTGN